jgi:peptidoglycan DL-endopeptidase LytE
LSKRNRFFSKLKVLGVRGKVQYGNLDITGKASSVKSLSRDSFDIFLSEIKSILFKPARQAGHFALVILILVVLSAGLPAPVVEGEKLISKVDPFGLTGTIEGTQKAGDKVTAVEVVASVASVLDEKLAEDAFKVADAEAAKTSLAVAGDSIAKVSALTTESSAANKAGVEEYIVQSGDTLSGIARKFGVTSDSIKWSNSMSDADFVKPGQTLLVPTINGIFYVVKAGESVEGIASKFKTSASLIIAQNDLYGEDLRPGMKLVIPDGIIQDAPPPPPSPRSPSQTRVATRGTAPSYVPSSSGPNRFPWGYCTWYVASKRHVPWRGNAHAWYGNSIAYGRSVGKVPVPGSIMVTWESPVGHVAYVESVSGNTFTVSEMNYTGYGRVSRRTITTSSVPLIGFIY